MERTRVKHGLIRVRRVDHDLGTLLLVVGGEAQGSENRALGIRRGCELHLVRVAVPERLPQERDFLVLAQEERARSVGLLQRAGLGHATDVYGKPNWNCDLLSQPMW